MIYVNDLSSSTQNREVFQYADDMTLWFKSSSKLELEINNFLREVNIFLINLGKLLVALTLASDILTMIPAPL